MNKLSEIQVDRLICLVRERPALFNTADKYHKNFALKETLWREISQHIEADEKDCKTAWKSLRDQFVKAAREDRTKAGTVRKTYKFYNKLLFLKDSLRNRKRSDWPADETAIVDFDASTMFSFTTPQNPLSSPGTMKKRRMNSRDDDHLKEMLSEMISEIKANTPRGENDAFFMNLASMVNKAHLSPNQTRQIQRKIFNFVAEVLDSIEYNRNWQVPPQPTGHDKMNVGNVPA